MLTSLNPLTLEEVVAADSVSCRKMFSASFAASQAVSLLINAALFKRSDSNGCSTVAVLTELCACTGYVSMRDSCVIQDPYMLCQASLHFLAPGQPPPSSYPGSMSLQQYLFGYSQLGTVSMTPWPFYTPWNAKYVAQISHTHSGAL